MDVQDYETVLAVYRHQSWSEAAYQTYQVASTVSKRVSKVEKSLGVQIFVRGGKQPAVTLTEAGEIVIPYMEQIVDTYHRICTYAGEMQESRSAEVSVGYQALIGTLGETEILARFRADHPNVALNHVHGNAKNLSDQVCDGKLDCAFLFLVDSAPGNREIWKRLFGADMGMITVQRRNKVNIGISRLDPLSQLQTVSAAQLKNKVYVFNAVPDHENAKSGYIPYVLPYNPAEGESRIRRFDFRNRQMVLDFVAADHGVLPTACIPPDNVRDIAFVEMEKSSFPISCVFIYPKDTVASPVREMVKYVKDYAAEKGQKHELE